MLPLCAVLVACHQKTPPGPPDAAAMDATTRRPEPRKPGEFPRGYPRAVFDDGGVDRIDQTCEAAPGEFQLIGRNCNVDCEQWWIERDNYGCEGDLDHHDCDEFFCDYGSDD